MVSPLNHQLAQEIYTGICIHNEEPGGRQVQIIGKPGCGKTTVLQHIVQKLFYWDRVTNTLEKETIIWRARTPLDYWNYFLDPTFEWEDPKFIRPVVVFRHVDDICSFVLEKGGAVNVEVKTYRSVPDLISQIVKGAINVVYEPPTHKFTNEFVKVIRGRGMRPFKELNEPVDGSKLWYELFYYLVRADLPSFITVIMDEADEVFLTQPLGVDWHLHTLVRDAVRDFRKKGITFIVTYHTYGDLDWMVSSKIGITGWMKGRPAPEWSQTRTYYDRGGFHGLDPGVVIWESHGFGTHRFPPIKYRKRVIKIEREKPKFPIGPRRAAAPEGPARYEGAVPDEGTPEPVG